MAESADVPKVDLPSAAVDAVTVFGPPVSPATCITLPPVTKKKSSYRPAQSGSAMAEQILEAVAATKERQTPKLSAVKKVISAAGYSAEKTVAPPGQSAKSYASKDSAQCGAEGSLATSSQQKVDGASREKSQARKRPAKNTRKNAKGRKKAEKLTPMLRRPRKRRAVSRTVRGRARRK
ncbi:histone H1.2-like [Mobula hypostoma]|uniref:histone H1.2-like n=1 Tax=Mobula hypostoma TaxID=723540 RepID=UPI002FC3A9CE